MYYQSTGKSKRRAPVTRAVAAAAITAMMFQSAVSSGPFGEPNQLRPAFADDFDDYGPPLVDIPQRPAPKKPKPKPPATPAPEPVPATPAAVPVPAPSSDQPVTTPAAPASTQPVAPLPAAPVPEAPAPTATLAAPAAASPGTAAPSVPAGAAPAPSVPAGAAPAPAVPAPVGNASVVPAPLTGDGSTPAASDVKPAALAPPAGDAKPAALAPAAGDAKPANVVPPVTADSGAPPSNVASPPDLPVSWGASGAKNLLYRSVDTPMGDNDAVVLWIKGDGSGATFRVRVFTSDAKLDDAESAMLSPMWISRPIKITFAGWRQVLIPRSRFTKRLRSAAPEGVDPALPADVQVGSSAGRAVQPDWSTVNSIALETNVPATTSLIVDDIAWTKLGPDGAPTTSDHVADMETGDVASWKSVGPPEQQSTLTYGITTKTGLVHGGRVALKLDILSPGAYRKKVLLPAAQKVMAASGNPYLVFVPKSTFATVLRSTLPELGGSSSFVNVQTCADQTQAAAFCIYSKDWMRNVTVTLADDLVGTGRKFPKANIDVRVVKYWNQDGYGPLRDPDQAGLVPKFLVKDDRVKLTGTASPIRLTGDPATDLSPDMTKEFWVTVKTPANVKPGHYTGKFLVTSPIGPKITVPIDVEVLPVKLMSPAKEYVINLRSRTDTPPDALPTADGRELVTDFVSRDMLDKQLANISDHGIHLITLNHPEPSLWDVLPDYKAAGFRAPYIYTGPTDPMQVESERAAHGSPEFLYFMPPSPGQSSQLAQLQKSGLQTTAYVPHQADFERMGDNLSYVMYDRESEYAQQLVRTHGKRVSFKHDWWYWQAASEDAATNRDSAGWLLWRSKLYGGFVADYQSTLGTDPFDEHSTGAPQALSAYRPQMLTYPVQDGVIDTVQWEAVREGINDVRYLTTFFAALRECKDNHVAKDLVTEAESYVTLFLDKPLPLLSDSDYQEARTKIAGYAVTLRKAVDAFYKANPQ